MTDHRPALGEGGPTAPADLLERRDPTSVTEALDLYNRLGALSRWVNARKGDVHRWAERLAEERRIEDGAAPKWATGDGTVLQTNPEPTPTIADREAFARWYVASCLGRDPDEPAPADGPRQLKRFDEHVARRRVASVPDGDLLAFVDAVGSWSPEGDTDAAARWSAEGHSDAVVRAASVLAGRISVEVEWLIGEAVLDDLLAGKLRPTADGDPRIKLDKARQVVIDPTSGERIPGVLVKPPAARQVQIRPNADARARVERELRGLLGPPELGG